MSPRQPRRPCRRSSMRWPGSAWSTTRVRSTRCSGWTDTERCYARWRSAACSLPLLHAAGPSSTNCARAQRARGENAALRRSLAPRERRRQDTPGRGCPGRPIQESVDWAASSGTIASKGGSRSPTPSWTTVLARPTARRPTILRRRRRPRHADHACRPRRRLHVNNTRGRSTSSAHLGPSPPRIRARAARARRRRRSSPRAPRASRRHALRGAGLPAGGNDQFSRRLGWAARRRRGVHARRVGRVVRARRVSAAPSRFNAASSSG